MDDSLRKNPNFARSSLLYEYFRGNPIFETYKNFCKVMGDDVMEYREFECWYMRFSCGNHDLTSDEHLQSSNRLLLDMPIEILQKIVKETTWKDVFALRQVSRQTRAIVETTKIVYKGGIIKIQDFVTTLTIDGESEVYRTAFPDDFQVDLVRRDVENAKRAFHKIHVLMKPTKVYLAKLVVDCRSLSSDPYDDNFDIDFNVYHLRAKTFCKIGDCPNIDFVWDCLEPGTLEEIEFENSDDMSCADEGDHWNQAKSLKIDTCRCNPCGFIDHFARIDIKDCPLNVKNVIELKNRLVKSRIFEKCRLRGTFNGSDITAFEEQLGSFVREKSDDPNYLCYSIKKGKKVFKLKVGRKLFEMERIR